MKESQKIIGMIENYIKMNENVTRYQSKNKIKCNEKNLSISKRKNKVKLRKDIKH